MQDTNVSLKGTIKYHHSFSQYLGYYEYDEHEGIVIKKKWVIVSFRSLWPL